MKQKEGSRPRVNSCKKVPRHHESLHCGIYNGIMATIKIKLRPSGVQGKAGTIIYQISHHRVTRQISTDIHIAPECWDDRLHRIALTDVESGSMQHRIDGGLSVLSFIIKNLESRGSAFTADDIVSQFRRHYDKTMLVFMKEQIDYLRRCNRIGTAGNYERAMRSFARFIGDDLPIVAITERLIDDYNAYLLQRGVVRNSISFYMRILRAVYNKAVRQHLAEPANPFEHVYTGIDRTRKRAVDEKIIADILKTELSPGSPLELARDIFIFSFCTRGMAFVDIAYLKKSDIKEGMIHYARHKTGQLMSIRIEPNIAHIINRYRCNTDDSPYVFPIIKSADANEAYNEYRKGINLYNRQLKELSKKMSLDCTISSYTARHSWAMAARKHNAPLSIISAGLGHTSEKTTQIYLTSLDNNEINSINQGIISKLYQ